MKYYQESRLNQYKMQNHQEPKVQCQQEILFNQHTLQSRQDPRYVYYRISEQHPRELQRKAWRKMKSNGSNCGIGEIERDISWTKEKVGIGKPFRVDQHTIILSRL